MLRLSKGTNRLFHGLRSTIEKSLITRNISSNRTVSIDGNTAAAHIAYGLSEIAIIYPITPASPMGEITDHWSANKKLNAFGDQVKVVEMESELGVAGTLHGSLTSGSLATTFTSSQGLLLMYPNLFKISGELLPCVIHVASRAVAGQALSIYGDHNDVMAVRPSGFSLLCSGSPQESMDLAAASHMTTLKSQVPFLHFFDGFRVSHEINSVDLISYETLSKLINPFNIQRFRQTSLNPFKPFIRGSSQNPDIYFQMVESSNKFYNNVPKLLKESFDELNEYTGRKYDLFTYYGHPDAERVIVTMGSSYFTIKNTVQKLWNTFGEKIGVVKVNLYRPFSVKDFESVLPPHVQTIAVLDRTKESGSLGEPLFLDICNVLKSSKIRIIGGRYGLGSKDILPNDIFSIYQYMKTPSNYKSDQFTVGINDDITHLSIPTLPFNLDLSDDIPNLKECIFWGYGSDGTVGANKEAIKIITKESNKYGQGYFSYSAHKSGGLTTSYLRFGDKPIDAPYIITNANYIGCHNSTYLEKYEEELVANIKEKGILVVNCPWISPQEFNNHISDNMRKILIQRKVEVYSIDADTIAQDAGLGERINIIMQAVFFKLINVIPWERSKELLREFIIKSYSNKGKELVESNLLALENALTSLTKISINLTLLNHTNDDNHLPEFIRNVHKPLLNLKGNNIKVSQCIPGGILPPSTSKYEERNIAPSIPYWDPKRCTECNLCSIICPHAVIRTNLLPKNDESGQEIQYPKSLHYKKAFGVKDDSLFTITVSGTNCTGCTLCSKICPSKCLTMIPNNLNDNVVNEINNNYKYVYNFTDNNNKYNSLNQYTLKGSQFNKPLFEFSGACSGCGETPYIKLLTQLYGSNLYISNATGCSSIYGASYPSNPYTTLNNGRGPAWANSLFEDNAEFGYGISLSIKERRNKLKKNIETYLTSPIDQNNNLNSLLIDWVKEYDNYHNNNVISDQIIEYMKANQSNIKNNDQNNIYNILNNNLDIVNSKSIWILGGDGWAYDIGYNGIDHILATNDNVNVMVLDTEVYSNTGGQSSKSTPRSAVAKFAANGKNTKKKDLGLISMSYGHIYVGSIAIGADPKHAVDTIVEAFNYNGPSIILAYSSCIGHGIKGGLGNFINEQKAAIDSGYWLLYRYNPTNQKLSLDSKPTFKGIKEFINNETRFNSLNRGSTFENNKIKNELIDDVVNKYKAYLKLSGSDNDRLSKLQIPYYE